jgi:hypothetical protein
MENITIAIYQHMVEEVGKIHKNLPEDVRKDLAAQLTMAELHRRNGLKG